MKKENDYQQEAVNEIYEYAANLLVKEKKSAIESKNALIAEGLDKESASVVVTKLERQIKDIKKVVANKGKDVLYGALWCIGGIVATVADFS
jgi:hypothetical protein